MEKMLKHFDRCDLVAMDTGRQQQIDAHVASGRRIDLQYAVDPPLKARAGGAELDLFRRLATGEGQLEQFAQGKHVAHSRLQAVTPSIAAAAGPRATQW